MKFQNLFSGKNKKIIIYLSSAELAQRMVKVKFLTFKTLGDTVADDMLFFFYFFFRENKTWHFMTDNSHEMSGLIFSEIECHLLQ